jgi:hypothetical protein
MAESLSFVKITPTHTEGDDDYIYEQLIIYK